MLRVWWNTLRGRVWIALLAALALFGMGTGAMRGAPAVTSQVPQHEAPLPAILEDDRTEILRVDPPRILAVQVAVHEDAKGERESHVPAIDWASMSAGVAEVAMPAGLETLEPVDLETGLSPEEARTLIAVAEGAGPVRGVGPGVGAVIGRGTPRGGGSCD